MWCFFFFFQAEDGIRDVAVTGVQTCALPISHRAAAPVSDGSGAAAGVAEDLDGKPEAEFWLAAGNWAGCRRGRADFRLPGNLFVGLPDSVRVCRVDGGAGVLSRRESDSRPIGRFVFGIRGGPHDAQYAALRRLYRSYGDGVRLYRVGRHGV